MLVLSDMSTTKSYICAKLSTTIAVRLSLGCNCSPKYVRGLDAVLWFTLKLWGSIGHWAYSTLVSTLIHTSCRARTLKDSSVWGIWPLESFVAAPLERRRPLAWPFAWPLLYPFATPFALPFAWPLACLTCPLVRLPFALEWCVVPFP